MRTMLRSKIHRATVTDVDVAYEGSITIDKTLLEAADVLEHERVEVLNIHNGARFSTYALAGERDSGQICINGAAARLAAKGDLVIIITYQDMPEDEAHSYSPRLVFVDEKNRITSAGKRESMQTLISRLEG